MARVRWIATSVVAAVLSTSAFADAFAPPADAQPRLSDIDLEALDERLVVPLTDFPLDANRIGNDSAWRTSLDDFEFEEGSALMRISKLRSLSLLTLGEFGKSRLFIGVNSDGFVGLHFNAVSREADQRYLEVVRMPYLSRDEAATD